MDWVFRAAPPTWDYSRELFDKRASRLRKYTFDLIDPQSGKPGTYVFGWTLTLRRPHPSEQAYAASMNTPPGAWLTFFDPSWYESVFSGYGIGVERTRSDPDWNASLNGWVHPPTDRFFFPDEELKRRFQVLLLFQEEMLPRARLHPPFVRSR